MSTPGQSPQSAEQRQRLTVGQLRDELASLPTDTTLIVGVRDQSHTATLLGEYVVESVRIMSDPSGAMVVFEVKALS